MPTQSRGPRNLALRAVESDPFSFVRDKTVCLFGGGNKDIREYLHRGHPLF